MLPPFPSHYFTIQRRLLHRAIGEPLYYLEPCPLTAEEVTSSALTMADSENTGLGPSKRELDKSIAASDESEQNNSSGLPPSETGPSADDVRDCAGPWQLVKDRVEGDHVKNLGYLSLTWINHQLTIDPVSDDKKERQWLIDTLKSFRAAVDTVMYPSSPTFDTGQALSAASKNMFEIGMSLQAWHRRARMQIHDDASRRKPFADGHCTEVAKEVSAAPDSDSVQTNAEGSLTEEAGSLPISPVLTEAASVRRRGNAGAPSDV